MTAPDIDGLVERLSALSGPDREVDEAIMAALFVRDERHTGVMEATGDDDNWRAVKSKVWVDPKTDQWVSTHAHCFTESIDAALTLVPQEESSNFEVAFEQHKRRTRTYWTVFIGHMYRDAWQAQHQQAAIALCIAALRACAALKARAQDEEVER